MQNVRLRRNFLKLVSMACPLGLLGFEPKTFGLTAADQQSSVPDAPVSDLFPTQAPELAREMVTVSHYDLHHVKELVEARPSLARAAWDWGFGDWETALGAASHMGNRPIAEYLISKGARPSVFSSAMLGHLDVIKAFVAAQPGVQRIRGPHSISLLAHAKAGGEVSRPVFDFLQSLGGAGAEPLIPLTESESASIQGAMNSVLQSISRSMSLSIMDRRTGLEKERWAGSFSHWQPRLLPWRSSRSPHQLSRR